MSNLKPEYNSISVKYPNKR